MYQQNKRMQSERAWAEHITSNIKNIIKKIIKINCDKIKCEKKIFKNLNNTIKNWSFFFHN